MAIFYIGLKPQNINNTIYTNSFSYDGNGFCFSAHYKDNDNVYSNNINHNYTYLNPRPLINENGKYMSFESSEISNNYRNLLPKIQNEVIGVNFTSTENNFTLIANSVRMSRGRIYFIILDFGIYLSNDLRELLPFSNRRANLEIIYGILKYGDIPEIYTHITDIYAVPSSSYLELDNILLKKLIRQGKPTAEDFNFYFKIKYPMTGGNIAKTSQILSSVSEYYAQNNASVFISGGVDSTLMNFMINEHASKPYNGYYYHFGENDKEIGFARKSILGTKCDLNIIEIKKKDYLNYFEDSIENLIVPIFDNGSIFAGSLLNKHLASNNIHPNLLIDATSADGNYGSKNYNNEFPNYKHKLYLRKRVNEFISVYMINNKVKGYKKFFPRDSFIDDKFLQELQWYLGPYANVWFKNAKIYTQNLYPKYKWYLSIIDKNNSKVDNWVEYTIYKLFLYASKQTCAKTFDMLNKHEVSYPFMFQDVLNDQGLYSWSEKTQNGIIKYPLKKMLEKYIEPNFIYRNKVGLNSSMLDWLRNSKDLGYFIELIELENGLAHNLIGKKNTSSLIHLMQTRDDVHYFLNIVLAIAGIQRWMIKHNITI